MQTRNTLGRYALVALLAAGATVVLSGIAAAQQPPATGAQEQVPPDGGVADPLGEEIPEGIELAEGTGYNYESGGRRDPFVSLALGVNVLDPTAVRPPGLQGMLIQEVSLRGIVKTADGYIAMIQGTDNKSYFARDSERLYDGHIQEITDDKVIFRQEIRDPLRIEQFQEVEKTLHPLEEQR